VYQAQDYTCSYQIFMISSDESQISEGFQLALRWYARVCDARGAAQAALGEAIPPALASADRPADAWLLRELNRTENNP
jgi:hypothetical protein